MSPSSAAAAMLQGHPLSNSNSSFDADISDDSQILEKLEENAASQNNQQTHKDEISNSEMMDTNANKMIETKCPESMPSEAQMMKHTISQNQLNLSQKSQSNIDKTDNGISDAMQAPKNVAASAPQKNVQNTNWPDQANNPYMMTTNNNSNNYNKNMGNKCAAPFMGNAECATMMPQQSYNYNYNSNNNMNNGNNANNSVNNSVPHQKQQPSQIAEPPSQMMQQQQQQQQQVNESLKIYMTEMRSPSSLNLSQF